MWSGEHGFLDRTSNMLKNLERALWITSYQMHYTGSGPANHLKIDDYKEKMSDLAGLSSHTAPLGWRRRPESCVGRSACSSSPPTSLTPPQRESDRDKRLTKHSKERHSRPTVAKDQAANDFHTEILSSAASGGRELSSSIANPCVLPRPPVLPRIHPADRVGTVSREGAPLNLLVLQNSFSKSEAHRNFNSSIVHAAVNLRDNVATEKKHDFYGIKCYYLHG
ncbi:hypothetical protein Q8A73_008038 [Channa argus]|nr:hypothetical protein Q8A73_008038 [Channa argus]